MTISNLQKLGEKPKLPQKNYSIVLFLLPEAEEAWLNAVQDRFFLDPHFWSPWLGRLHFWSRPVALTKTQGPDGKPALALIMTFCEHHELLDEVGSGIAKALRLPAFMSTISPLDAQDLKELEDAPQPWKELGKTEPGVQ